MTMLQSETSPRRQKLENGLTGNLLDEIAHGVWLNLLGGREGEELLPRVRLLVRLEGPSRLASHRERCEAKPRQERSSTFERMDKKEDLVPD